MCLPGNQTIYRQCRDEIFRTNNYQRLRNREMRFILAKHGGCMSKPLLLDKEKKPMLTS
jgi:hypothetical protein